MTFNFRKFPIAFLFIILYTACSGGSNPAVPGGIDDDGRPAGYETVISAKVARWDLSAFPLNVYVDPAPPGSGSAAESMRIAANSGVDAWDLILPGVPDIFNAVATESEADIVVRWESGTDGAFTRVTDFGGRLEIHKIALSENLRNPGAIKLLVSHELGHVLGLGHSTRTRDLMFTTVNVLKTKMSSRDIEMFKWLYSQSTYVKITSGI